MSPSVASTCPTRVSRGTSSRSVLVVSELHTGVLSLTSSTLRTRSCDVIRTGLPPSVARRFKEWVRDISKSRPASPIRIIACESAYSSVNISSWLPSTIATVTSPFIPESASVIVKLNTSVPVGTSSDRIAVTSPIMSGELSLRSRIESEPRASSSKIPSVAIIENSRGLDGMFSKSKACMVDTYPSVLIEKYCASTPEREYITLAFFPSSMSVATARNNSVEP